MALPALAKVLAAAGAGDLVKDLAKPAVVALIAKITGVNIANPDFDSRASSVLKEREDMRAQLVRDIKSLDLESQKTATEVELK
ncbi:MAG: hypothetical protein AAF404_09000, partial [Pseudomonadota bacterium]